MPCNMPYGDVISCTNNNNTEILEIERELESLNKLNINLEAGLCSIINELDKMGLTFKVLTEAEKNGKCKLFAFWEKHYKSDESRLERSLCVYSNHELKLIKKILKKVK